jgi:hypothetical protein
VEIWVKIHILISLDHVLEGSSSNNLTKMIMEALTIKGGMLRHQVVSKLMSFGVDDVNVFQDTKYSVTKHIWDDYAPFSIGVHCMAHHTNVIV